MQPVLYGALMRKTAIVGLLVFVFLGNGFLFAQTNVSVPVDNAVYYILDQAEARGLCAPLPAVKPYTRAKVLETINEILSSEPSRFGTLTASERSILEDTKAEFEKGAAGFDPWKGKYRFETQGKSGVSFSGDVGLNFKSINSLAYYQDEKDAYVGTDTWGTLFLKGDVGGNFSFGVDLSGGIMRAERSYLGQYDTYATELVYDPDKSNFENQRIDVYSQPKAFFPYTYQKSWDGFIFGAGQISSSNMESWPQKFSMGPSWLAEMSGTFWGDMLFVRFGRIQREWGAMIPGSSLVFNANARPFVGLEGTFSPVSWFSFSSLTGVLEYYNTNNSLKDSAASFQNAFSIGQLEFNKDNIFHIDFGSTAIWPKRFEPGYIFPLMDNYIYQNFIGDFDNMAIFLNIRGRYPGLGGVWFSFFLDEAEVSSMLKGAFNMDRQMFAYQFGLQGIIPGVPFASVSVCYTKIEPYNYTHTRDFVPWYTGPMETSYTNNGVGLGYYLPPNSDEIKVRFDIHPWLRTSGSWQYQLIRHGADYGPQQVDGSSLVSELDPSGRGSKESLMKNFLNDGAYQWMHIIKLGMEHTFSNLPLTVFGEVGLVYSYFTQISDTDYEYYHPTPTDGRNDNGNPAGQYFASTSYIFTLGFRIFK